MCARLRPRDVGYGGRHRCARLRPRGFESDPIHRHVEEVRLLAKCNVYLTEIVKIGDDHAPRRLKFDRAGPVVCAADDGRRPTVEPETVVSSWRVVDIDDERLSVVSSK